MKNKKAIRILKSIEYYLKSHTIESCEEEHTAISLAIKALEERPQGDLISRSELKKALRQRQWHIDDIEEVEKIIDNAPTVELTEEQAIDKLHETGWLIRHDKEMTERPHIIDNCDMNVFEPEKYMEGGAK